MFKNRRGRKESARHLIPLHRQISIISTGSVQERIHKLMRLNSKSGYPTTTLESELHFRAAHDSRTKDK